MARLARRGHAPADRAQDSAPPWEVADIWRLDGPTASATPPVPPSPHQGLHDLLVWRTAERGGHACRHRPCPTCQPLSRAQGLEDRTADLLEGPSCHCVFPLPPALTPLVLTNQRALLTLLVRTTSQTLLQFGDHHLGGQLRGLLLLHPWAQTLQAPCHGHALVPGGALADKGTRWVSPPPRCLLPAHAVGIVCRAKVLEALHDSRATWM